MEIWREEIKTRPVWNLTFEDELWEDEDEDSAEDNSKDFAYLAECDSKDTYFTMVTGSNDIKAGEQLLISYGNRSNSNLLLQYGFAYQDNPFDYAEITGDDGLCWYFK